MAQTKVTRKRQPKPPLLLWQDHLDAFSFPNVVQHENLGAVSDGGIIHIHLRLEDGCKVVLRLKQESIDALAKVLDGVRSSFSLGNPPIK